MELDDNKKFLMATAMCCINYNEYLKIDEKRQIETLGFVLRVYKDKLNEYTPQGLALLITYLTNIKEEYFLEYITLFDNETITTIIGKSKTIDDQINYLNYFEDKYFEFMEEPFLIKELKKLL